MSRSTVTPPRCPTTMSRSRGHRDGHGVFNRVWFRSVRGMVLYLDPGNFRHRYHSWGGAKLTRISFQVQSLRKLMVENYSGSVADNVLPAMLQTFVLCLQAAADALQCAALVAKLLAEAAGSDQPGDALLEAATLLHDNCLLVRGTPTRGAYSRDVYPRSWNTYHDNACLAVAIFGGVMAAWLITWSIP